MSTKPPTEIQPPPVAAAAGAAPSSDAASATKRPVDPEKRAAAARRAAVRNLLARAHDAKDVDELWSKLDKLRGKTPEKKPESGGAVTPEVSGPQSPAGFPSVDAVAAVTPTVAAFWGDFEASAKGGIFELPEPTTRTVRMPVSDGQGGFKMVPRTVEVDAVMRLTEGTAPLAAKLGGKMLGNVYSLAAVALLGVFGRPLGAIGFALGKQWWANRAARIAAAAQEPKLKAV